MINSAMIAKNFLQTQDLELNPISFEDQQDLIKYLTKDICQFMDNDPFANNHEAKRFIEYHIELMKENRVLTLIARKNNVFVGMICLAKINTGIPEFGLWVAKHQQNKTYGKQMLNAVYKWALEQNKFLYLLYPVIATNLASRKIVEFINGHYLYHKEEIIKQHKHVLMYYHVPTLLNCTKK